ncbi:hypothetical protein SAMN05444340_11055 [Citreimonas salinaria]|uniref:Uncharacterized protein n=1 Tax=Citreimonas salinaria TaxID=321339 RepID=A0A1H3KR20_9RHOB|nr:hypothetical protein SAMN05444340_11055 [Citreimonas salinaria]
MVQRSKEDFKALFTQFLKDVRDGKISSRAYTDDVIEYAKDLVASVGVGDDFCDKYDLADAFDEVEEDVSEEEESDEDEESDDNERIRPRTMIGRNADVEHALVQVKNQKLEALYASCCDLSLSRHTPLITVGFWSILEALASLHARGDAKFQDYFGKDRLRSLGFTDKRERDDVWEALQNISRKGNATKHSPRAAHFDGSQLANDVDVIAPFLKAVCDEISTRP